MNGENKLYTKTRKYQNQHDNAVWDIQATKEYIYSAGFDGKINEWDVNNGNLMCTFNIKEGEEGHDGQIWSCTVDEKNKRMYSVVPYLQVLEGHINTVTCVASLPDESQLLTGSSDRSVIQWYPLHDAKWDPNEGNIGCCQIV